MTDDELRDAVLVELGIDPDTATTLQQAQVARKVKQAKAKVLLYLGRDTLTTHDVVVTELYRNPDVTDPAEDGAYLPVPCLPDYAHYVSAVANTNDPDLWDVTYRVGIDLAQEKFEPINEFLIADAAQAARYDPAFTAVERAVTSVNSGGQSISYEKRPQSPDDPGGQLTIGTLARFKRRAIGQSRTADQTPLPYRSYQGDR